MIEIFVDNQRLEIPENTSIGLSVGIANIEDPISASASYSQTIKVPNTPHNSVIFRHAEQILLTEVYNHEEHTAAIYEDGVELIKGKAYLDGATDKEYSIQIVGNEFAWLERIRDKKLNEMDDEDLGDFVAYAEMTPEQHAAAFFALIDHGCWWQEVGEDTIRRRWATYADLVPFVGITTILQSIFKGYTLDYGSVKDFLSRLYITGQWRRSDNADTRAKDNEFEVSSTGKNVNEFVVDGNTEVFVGAILTANNDKGDPRYCEVFDNVDKDENLRIEVETDAVNIGGEQVEHTRCYYVPTEDLTCAFKLDINYTTDFHIKGTDIVFADTVSFHDGNVAQLSVEDSVESSAMNWNEPLNGDWVFEQCDYPKELPAITSQNPNIADEYKTAFVLKLSNPEYYTGIWQLTWSISKSGAVVKGQQLITQDVKAEQYVHAAVCFASRFGLKRDATQATIGLSTNHGDMIAIMDTGKEKAYKMLKFNGKYSHTHLVPDAHIYGNAKVSLYKFTEADTLTFNLKAITPSYFLSPMYSNSLAIGFASSKALLLDDGDKIFVRVGESKISPHFNDVIPYESTFSFNTIAGEDTATDMLKSIMHLCNMRIYTNEEQKRVYLLPFSDFYTDGVVDWRDRVDIDKGVQISTLGDSKGSKFTLCYQEGSEAVAEYNKRHKEPFLSWSQELVTKRSNEEMVLQNTLLTPCERVDTTAIFPQSQVGPSDMLVELYAKDPKQTLAELDNKIPRTLVMLPSPTGDPSDEIQWVGCTGLLADYIQPNVRIVDGETETSISFNDEPEVDGLNKYYYPQISAWEYGRRITCYCKLYPQEVASLRKAGTSVVDFRSRYLLKINGEDIYCRLESIENYEPLNATHKCTFIFFN